MKSDRIESNFRLATYSTVHFAVDLACIFLMTAFVLPLMGRTMDWLWCVVLYNLFAFAFQLPIGALGDNYDRPGMLAALGCVLVALAYIVIALAYIPAKTGLGFTVIFATVLAGVGNGFFHVGGGISTIRDSKGRASRPGIFVSTGAMGVYLASKIAREVGSPDVGIFAGILLMTLSAFALVKICGSHRLPSLDGKSVSPSAIGYVGIALLLLTVCIRSYTGGLFAYSWKSAPLMGFIFTFGIVLGKMLGGIVGDKIGWGRSSAVSLLVSLVFFQFAENSPVLGILGVLLFNMTMPITLMAIVNILGEAYSGTAFGLTTMALFVGILPSTFETFLGLNLTPMWMIAPTIAISAIAIYLGVKVSKRGAVS